MTWPTGMIVLAVIAGLALVAGRRLGARRHGAVRDWAEARGWSYRRGPDRRIGLDLLELPLPSDGPAMARHLVDGERDGRRVRVFDLAVGPAADGPADRTTRHTCALVAVDIPTVPMCLRPLDEYDRPAPDLGCRAEPADGWEAAATDEAWLDDLLTGPSADHALGGEPWRLETGGWWCLVAAPGQLPVERLDDLVAHAGGFVDRIPAAVRRRMLGR